MRKEKNFVKYAAAVYLLLYFLCNAAFLHNHIIDGQSISHAHIFKGINHSQDEAGLIQLYNLTSAESAPAASVNFVDFTFEFQTTILPDEIYISAIRNTLPLRGPPFIQFI